MKSGTTSLYEILRRHPQVDLVAEKESSELAAAISAERFAARIAGSTARVAGEVSTAYMQAPVHDQPTRRAAELGKNLRLIAIVRDPYQRAISHWQHWVQLGRESRPVEEALLDPDGPYRAFSSYYRQLGPWLDEFGFDSLHLIRLEDYQTDPTATARSLWEFLGVDARGDDDGVEVHANAATDRVVAVGAGRRIRDLPIYRLVRPLVPGNARRKVSAALGGTKNRQQADPTGDLRARFGELVAADVVELQAHWPQFRWD